MFDCFLAQLLVLIMLFSSELRIFFIKNPRIDCLAVFAPTALAISVINNLSFGFSITNNLIFLLSLFIFITNFRSILRFRANLLVDHYSTAFFISSLLNLLLLVALSFFTIYFRPAKINLKDFSVEKEKHHLTGNLSSDIRIRYDAFTGEKYSGNVFVYKPLIKNEPEVNTTSIAASLPQEKQDQPVLIFSGNVTGTTEDYEPLFLLLAQKGFTIVSADFYAPDAKLAADFTQSTFTKKIVDYPCLRKFFAKKLYLTDKELFNKMLESEKKYIIPRYQAASKIAMRLFGENTKLFYLTDGVDFETVYDLMEFFPANTNGFFPINRVAEYKTSQFGFIEQTNPLFAQMFQLKRDSSLFIPRYVANKTAEYINMGK